MNLQQKVEKAQKELDEKKRVLNELYVQLEKEELEGFMKKWLGKYFLYAPYEDFGRENIALGKVIGEEENIGPIVLEVTFYGEMDGWINLLRNRWDIRSFSDRKAKILGGAELETVLYKIRHGLDKNLKHLNWRIS